MSKFFRFLKSIWNTRKAGNGISNLWCMKPVQKSLIKGRGMQEKRSQWSKLFLIYFNRSKWTFSYLQSKGSKCYFPCSQFMYVKVHVGPKILFHSKKKKEALRPKKFFLIWKLIFFCIHHNLYLLIRGLFFITLLFFHTILLQSSKLNTVLNI